MDARSRQRAVAPSVEALVRRLREGDPRAASGGTATVVVAPPLATRRAVAAGMSRVVARRQAVTPGPVRVAPSTARAGVLILVRRRAVARTPTVDPPALVPIAGAPAARRGAGSAHAAPVQQGRGPGVRAATTGGRPDAAATCRVPLGPAHRRSAADGVRDRRPPDVREQAAPQVGSEPQRAVTVPGVPIVRATRRRGSSARRGRTGGRVTGGRPVRVKRALGPAARAPGRAERRPRATPVPVAGRGERLVVRPARIVGAWGGGLPVATPSAGPRDGRSRHRGATHPSALEALSHRRSRTTCRRPTSTVRRAAG